MSINNSFITIVNNNTKSLIYKKGTFFDLFKRCLLNDNYEKTNKIQNIFLTQLTAYIHHH